MKTSFIIFSDERRKEYCIRTDVEKCEGSGIVRKSSVYEEGKKHIESFAAKYQLLKKYFSSVKVANVEIKDSVATFPYIEGKLMLARYDEFFNSKNIEGIIQLAKEHCQIVCGNDNNTSSFYESDESRKWFGDLSFFEGEDGLLVSNYDAIASNIVSTSNGWCFIDYEWVFDFVLPREIVIYHCLSNMYLHNSSYEDVYPLKNLLISVGVKSQINVLERAYQSFYKQVIFDEAGNSFSVAKSCCQKKMEYETSATKLLDENRRIEMELNHCKLLLEKERREHLRAAYYWKQSDEELRKLRIEMRTRL